VTEMTLAIKKAINFHKLKFKILISL